MANADFSQKQNSTSGGDDDRRAHADEIVQHGAVDGEIVARLHRKRFFLAEHEKDHRRADKRAGFNNKEHSHPSVVNKKVSKIKPGCL